MEKDIFLVKRDGFFLNLIVHRAWKTFGFSFSVRWGKNDFVYRKILEFRSRILFWEFLLIYCWQPFRRIK